LIKQGIDYMSVDKSVPAPAGETEQPRAILGDRLKFVDGRWSCNEMDVLPNLKLAVVKTGELLQKWENERVVDTEDPRECNVEDLNAQTDSKTWEPDVTGNPKPPWQHTYFVYLFDPVTADRYTYAAATVGARIAYEDLTDKMHWMSRLKNKPVAPMVMLSSKLMKTRFGQKMRPHFNCVEWLSGDGGEKLPAPSAAPRLSGPDNNKKPTTEELLNDELPF
jgi:hypothetical protein